MAQHLIQAYQQAPWRIQIQRLRTFLLLILVFALVTGMYLYISAQAAVTGLNIQDGEYQIEILKRDNASLAAKLSELNSIKNMEARAEKAGYKPAAMDKGMYVMVQGYSGQPSFSLAPEAGPDYGSVSKIKPEYTQSLWEFLFQMVNGLKLNSGELQP